MTSSSFFQPVGPFSLAKIAQLTGATLSDDNFADREIVSAGPLESAGSDELSFLDNAKYASHLSSTTAGAIIASKRFAKTAPLTLPVLIHDRPYDAYALMLGHLYPTAMRPVSITGEEGVSAQAHISNSAIVEDGVTIEAGCVVGPGATIGSGSHLLAGAIIGQGVQIGRKTTVGPRNTITNSFVGDEVIIHAGCSIGQDGFGFSMGAGGHRKVPQIGRVIIQDKVEIGANTAIDRGANRDTVIGEGTKIDNLVQIGHNAVIGRHCVIVGLVGISGSATLGDYVVVAGQAGIVGHITIGDGAQIGGGSGVHEDVPAGSKIMGYPAISAKQWMRQAARSVISARKSEAGHKKKGA